MNRTGRIVLLLIAAALLIVAGLAACGWAFDDANLAALGFFAAAAWVLSQLP